MTFPFPAPTPSQQATVAAAAKELGDLRNRWLNPPEWTREEILEFPGSMDGPWARYVHDPDGRGIGTVRYPRLVPKDDDAAEQLRQRTLTNLYNQRPTWLDLITVWEMAAGRVVARFTGDAFIGALAGLNDNRTLVAGDGLGKLYCLRLMEAGDS